MGNGADLWLSDLQDISNAGQQERESVGCCGRPQDRPMAAALS